MRSEHANNADAVTLNHAEFKVKTIIGSRTENENFEENNKWEYDVCSRHGGSFKTNW